MNNNRREVYISDLYEYACEKDRLSPYTTKDKWEYVSYETSVTKGKLLIASDYSYPEPITIKPNLKGWYRIYICLGELCSNNHFDIKLSNDEFPRTVACCKMGPYSMWSKSENVEESFWMCADMSNQDIIIDKPKLGFTYASNIFWFHLVPMSDDEVNEYKAYKPNKTMIAHMDGDFNLNDITVKPDDYCKPIYAMKDSDIGIICQEITNDLFDFKHPGCDYVQKTLINTPREKAAQKLKKIRKSVYPIQVEYAHKCNMKLFAAQRMQLSNFSFPLTNPMYHMDFVEKHPQLLCKARDNSNIGFLSYGYKETQDYSIKALLDAVKLGFDGVLCIWTRGYHLGFENPVRERYFKNTKSDIDISLLPENDKNLIKAKCDIIFDFHKKLKRVLSTYAKKNNRPDIKIYITGCYDVFSSKKDGIDIERLAKNKLIDGVIQTKFKQIELVQDVLDENGYIDIDKYKEKAKHEKIFDRISGSRIDLLVDGTLEYRKIADKYALDYHTEIQWEGLKKAEEYVNGAKQILSSNGKGISLWDCYPTITSILSEWHAVSSMGVKDKVMSMSEDPNMYHKIIKVLSYNNTDIKYIDPSWRG